MIAGTFRQWRDEGCPGRFRWQDEKHGHFEIVVYQDDEGGGRQGYEITQEATGAAYVSFASLDIVAEGMHLQDELPGTVEGG